MRQRNILGLPKLLLTFCCCLVTTTIFCQDWERATSAYGEYTSVSGISLFTVNYDRRFIKQQDQFGFRFGFGVLDQERTSYMIIPIGINYLRGNAPHYIETGFGITVITAHKMGTGYSFVPSLGYRFQPEEKGVTFRAFVATWLSGGFLLSGGVSAGLKF